MESNQGNLYGFEPGSLCHLLGQRSYKYSILTHCAGSFSPYLFSDPGRDPAGPPPEAVRLPNFFFQAVRLQKRRPFQLPPDRWVHGVSSIPSLHRALLQPCGTSGPCVASMRAPEGESRGRSRPRPISFALAGLEWGLNRRGDDKDLESSPSGLLGRPMDGLRLTQCWETARVPVVPIARGHWIWLKLCLRPGGIRVISISKYGLGLVTSRGAMDNVSFAAWRRIV